MSYHVETKRFDVLPEQIVVREDGYMDACKNESEPIADYVYVPKSQIAELEAQIADLARENAVLKQAPRHSDDSPRCPLRDGMTGEMGACDKRCAWLVRVGGVLMCAEAARVADEVQMEPVGAVNCWNEVD